MDLATSVALSRSLVDPGSSHSCRKMTVLNTITNTNQTVNKSTCLPTICQLRIVFIWIDFILLIKETPIWPCLLHAGWVLRLLLDCLTSKEWHTAGDSFPSLPLVQ